MGQNFVSDASVAAVNCARGEVSQLSIKPLMFLQRHLKVRWHKIGACVKSYMTLRVIMLAKVKFAGW